MSAPIRIRAVRYQCPHCRRTWAKRAAAEAHIARCWRNPATRGCKTCANFWPSEEGPYDQHPGWAESCGVRRDISAGLATRCPQWEPS